MANVLSFLASAIVAVLLLFIYPVSQSYSNQDQIAFNITQKAVTTFVDAVRSKGYITPTMYEDFMMTLDATNHLYDIQMQHDIKKYNPIYDDPANSDSFQNEFEVYYDSIFGEQIKSTLFPENTTLSKDDPKRRYTLNMYDYFSVTIKNTNTTPATLIRDRLNNMTTSDPTRIYIPYGGMILNEDH